MISWDQYSQLSAKDPWFGFLACRNSDIVACFTAYFDESGTDDGSPTLVVGGAVSDISCWQSNCSEWQAALDDYGVSAFHAKDYNTRHGEFAGWEDAKRHEFIDRLLGVIRADDRLSIICATLQTQDYRQEIAKYPHEALSDYQFLCLLCALYVVRFHQLRRDLPPVEIIFEAGQKFHSEKMVRLLDDLRTERLPEILNILPLPKKGKVPFQIADLIIYEFRKTQMSAWNDSLTDLRYQFEKLGDKKGLVKALARDEIRDCLRALQKPPPTNGSSFLLSLVPCLRPI